MGKVILETLVGYEQLGYQGCGGYIIVQMIGIESGLPDLSLDVMLLC